MESASTPLVDWEAPDLPDPMETDNVMELARILLLDSKGLEVLVHTQMECLKSTSMLLVSPDLDRARSLNVEDRAHSVFGHQYS